MDLVLLQEMPSIKFVEGKKVKQNARQKLTNLISGLLLIFM